LKISVGDRIEFFVDLKISVGGRIEFFVDLKISVGDRIEFFVDLKISVGDRIEYFVDLKISVGDRIEEFVDLKNSAGSRIEEFMDLKISAGGSNVFFIVRRVRLSKKLRFIIANCELRCLSAVRRGEMTIHTACPPTRHPTARYEAKQEAIPAGTLDCFTLRVRNDGAVGRMTEGVTAIAFWTPSSRLRNCALRLPA
jgi:hypothetical protein